MSRRLSDVAFVVYPLVKRHENIYLYVIKYLYIASIICVFSVIIFFSKNQLYFRISTIVFLSLLVLNLIAKFIFKRYKIIGEIKLTEDSIIVNDNETFILKELSNIKINYNGYAGEPLGGRVGALNVNDGAGNKISFDFGNNHYTFVFYIKNEGFAMLLLEMKKKWGINGIILR
jgi:hypothetical protein